MNGSQPVSYAFPRPGPVLGALLIAMSVVGVLTAFLAAWVPAGAGVFGWFAFEPDHPSRLPWSWLTSGLLTSPTGWTHLLFSIVGLYFLGAPLESRWGPWRFSRFLILSVVLGNLVTVAISRVTPLDAAERFHPDMVFGPAAAITAIAVAWSREYAESTVQLMLLVPIRGKVLLWLTVGFCALDLVYPAGMPEGVVAPFGGLFAGLLFSGTPSLSRSLWLRLRLALLRRQSPGTKAADLLARRPRRARADAPPLRVVSGGLEETLKKRSPTKDKRYLN
ncbi:MAG: rhomboid family intramembrane serine protease [Polyangiaceae bacterium]